MGLGAYPLVSLAEARDKAAEARKLLKQGVDPIDARKAESAQRVATGTTFRDVAER